MTHELSNSDIRADDDGSDVRSSTPRRLMFGLKMLSTLVGRIKLDGLDNLTNLPPEQGAVLAASHLTDIDMLVAMYALGEHRDLALSGASHIIKGPAVEHIGILAVGKANLFPIDFVRTGIYRWRQAEFNPTNYLPMAEAIGDGTSVLIAGHNRSTTRQFPRPGIGAPYLAALTEAPVIPVATVIGTEGKIGMWSSVARTVVKRPAIDVKLGDPLDLPPIPEIDRLGQIMATRKAIAEANDEERKADREELRTIKQQLQTNGVLILDAIKKLSE